MNHTKQKVQISQKQDECNVMCYHPSDFVGTQALGHVMYGYTLLVPMNQRVIKKLKKERIITGHK